MNNWNASTWISLLALVVSAMSFGSAVWSARLASKSLDESKTTRDEERKNAFERERSRLIELIAENRATLNRARLKIGALQANYENSPGPVRLILHNYTNLFSEYLPRIDRAIQQCTDFLADLEGWNHQLGISHMLNTNAKYKAIMEDDKIAYERALFLVSVFEQKLGQAHEYASHSTR